MTTANNLTWQPTSSKENLQKRATILKVIREFFTQHNVLEVETPILAQATVTNPYIQSLQCQQPNQTTLFYLQTSPEYHMKRLLASGSGSIFQICKTFRAEEQGRLHNTEFTLLEWYRLGFDQHNLMDEMEVLLQQILHCGKANRYSYQVIFQKYLNCDPLTVEVCDLKKIAIAHHLNDPGLQDDKTEWLMYLFSFVLEPKLQDLTFVYDFPAEQASLAKLNIKDPRVASRFEVYYRGTELANGFHELTDATEQRQRFMQDRVLRKKLGYAAVEIDEKFLQALTHGLPDCAGVALGIDRLVMLSLGATTIEEIVTFPFSRA